MNWIKFILISCLFTFSFSAAADWTEVGIAYNCDNSKSAFTVISTMDTSSDEYDVVAPSNYTNLEIGPEQIIECKLNDLAIKMNVSVFGPQASGMGQGAGVIFINKITMNDQILIGGMTNFNWQVVSERVLTEVFIGMVNGKLTSKRCMTDGWSWESQYQNEICETDN